ncbi:BON domain-containing protein [Thalassobaculum sp.]|uniref:BON domain-containing protein n=1 Tax=Thalassobaculum sp. TaxID=2022740 RepID=UPI0032EB14D7
MAALVLAAAAISCAPIQGRETAGEYVDDVTISTKVRTAIIGELGLKQIGVETMRNVVQLSGFVETPQVKTRAGDIARGVTGVKDVRNNLVVR